MLNMDPSTLRTTLAQLEHATQYYVEWHANLLREIVCGLPPDLNELAEDAHFNCLFGRWYYQQAPAELRAEPAFTAVGSQHERLHRVAARVLREVAANEPIVRDDFEELLARCAQLRRELDSLRHEIESALRNRDALTGAYDRVEMLRELREWHELAKRHVQTCCLVFMDLDHFKDINDRCGHHVGDAVLAGAVRFLIQHLRPYDKVFRYGGDEFLIALPGADLALGQMAIRRVRDGLERQPLVSGPDGSGLPVTASFGLALLDPEVSIEESIERADQALLLAKTAGRNRAISWDESVTTSTRLPRLRLEDVKE
ncbi:MAG: diguanylate cyclase [Steroidobacteraceae bacterium]